MEIKRNDLKDIDDEEVSDYYTDYSFIKNGIEFVSDEEAYEYFEGDDDEQ